MVVADAHPNFSICGIPYYVSGEVEHWSNLAHRTLADLKATGMQVRTDTLATGIDVPGKRLALCDADGRSEQLPYDALIVGTGAVSSRPPIEGLTGPDALGPADGVHLLHSMGDTFAVMQSLAARRPPPAARRPPPEDGRGRRRRLHRPGDGRGPHHPRHPRHPDRGPVRGTAHRRYGTRRPRPC
ncbi:hypothetical protein AB0I02_29750 [Streptomyces phaeochromogenes]